MRGTRRLVAWYLVVAMGVLGSVPRVYAGFCPSAAPGMPAGYDRTADLQTIQTVLEEKMVRARLEQLGFSREEIQVRLNQLSDQQIHQLALNLDDLRVGGNGAVTVLVILILIAIAVGVWFYVQGKKVAVVPR